MIFGWPFNKVVRSHEALFLGLLVGVIIGVILMITVTIHVKNESLKAVNKLCDTIENVESVNFSYSGNLKRVICKDQRVFTNF